MDKVKEKMSSILPESIKKDNDDIKTKVGEVAGNVRGSVVEKAIALKQKADNELESRKKKTNWFRGPCGACYIVIIGVVIHIPVFIFGPWLKLWGHKDHRVSMHDFFDKEGFSDEYGNVHS